MYNKDDKRRLYWLIEQYLSGEISSSSFCDEFYLSYDLELDKSMLTDNEQKAFAELSQIASRFSNYEEDFKLDPRAFATDKELQEKIVETKNKLASSR